MTTDDKIASLLLCYWDLRGDPIPFEHAKLMTAYQIVSLAEFHHVTYRALCGHDHPTVLTPMYRTEHRARTAKIDAAIIAKMRRATKRAIAQETAQPRKKRKIQSHGFPTKEVRAHLKAKYGRKS